MDFDKVGAETSIVPLRAPLLLRDPKTGWIVHDGLVAIFIVPVSEDGHQGRRQYLFEAGPGEALFSLATDSGTERHGLLAVPLEPSSLKRTPIDAFAKFEPAALAALIDTWVRRLGSALTGLKGPAGAIVALSEGHFSLTAGQALQVPSNEVAWVQIHRGEARYMAMETLTIPANSGVTPLASGMWIDAVGKVEGVILPSAVPFENPQAVFAALIRFHDVFLRCIDLLERQETLNRQQRLQERERINGQMMRGALQALAAAVKPEDDKTVPGEGTPVVIAMQAVAQALGIKVQRTATSAYIEAGSTPLEAFEQVSGIRMRKVLLREQWWQREAGPLLGFLAADNQPVALLPNAKFRYELFDSVKMTATPVGATSAAVLSPNAYMPYRPLPDSLITPVELIKFGLRGRRHDLIVILMTGVAAIILGMLTPLAVALVIDTGIPNADRSLLWQIALGLLAAGAGRAAFELVHSFAIVRIETSSTAATQAAVWDRLLKLKSSFFREYSTGDLQSRAAAIDEIRQKLGVATIHSLVIGFISSLNLLLMLYYSVRLTAVALGVAALVVAVTLVSGLLTLRQLRPLQAMEGQTFGLAVQLMHAIPKLRVAGSEKSAFALWARQYGQQQGLHRGLQRIADSASVFNQTLPALASALIFWVAAAGAGPIGGARISVGVFLAFSAAFGALIGGASVLSRAAIEAVSVLNLWERAKPILQAEPEGIAVKTYPGKLSGRVAVEHVTFRYRRDGPLVLNDLSLRADPGEFVGIVGPSGSGKSTILRLLLGFETPDSGAIYYDGQDVSGLALHPLRRQLGVVLQQSKVLSASIFENISAGTTISLDEAWAAALGAGLADDIKEMPMGMYTYVSEGATNLAGGQRQRLLIARALALKPKILLFDEATSALDNTKQAIVNESLEKLSVTRLVIAHRLSTILKADRIYVIDEGRVVQQGKFGDLTREDGLFARLAARQIV